MKEYSRTVYDVIGNDSALLDYWDGMPDEVKRILLASEITVNTLGELQLMSNQLRAQIDMPPKVF
ncbi:MAG: hypothetical protein R3Y07_00600 [Eubacteriales bacterium]